MGVSREIKIELSKAELWEIISSRNHLEKFHPFCKSNKTVSWSNGSYEDSIEYYGGRILGRKFYNWIEGIGYDLKIGDSSETILLFHGAFMKRRIAAQFRLRLCLTYLTEK